MSAEIAKFCLADINFTFSSLPIDAFNEYFLPFLSPESCLAETCFVEVAGVSSALQGLRAEGAWNFSHAGGRSCLAGANAEGVVMWRLTGDAPYSRIRFEWHPTAFEQMYRNEEYGTYGIVVLMALVLRLLSLGGLVMHGSAQVLDGAGIICTGPSGKGKSTLSRLFDAEGVPVLTDERPLVRPVAEHGQSGFRVYGSPWPSSGGFASSASAPLRKLYFLEHGAETTIEPLSRRAAVVRLLDVAMVPWIDTAFFDPLIETLEDIIDKVPYAVLRFRPDISAVEAVRRDIART
ncbi:MAG: hypothetical protein PHU80_09105 [Kiritimatiellae bacterium]|nr:hypothetical protein [Kiritimatiellia bacterium]